MKKTFAAIAFFGLFIFMGNMASAQISELKFQNNSNCDVIVEAIANGSNCLPICSSGQVTVPANTLVSIQLQCTGADRGSTIQVNLQDGQAQVRVGNGCGLPLSDPYLDCFGTPRTLVVLAPNFVAVN